VSAVQRAGRRSPTSRADDQGRARRWTVHSERSEGVDVGGRSLLGCPRPHELTYRSPGITWFAFEDCTSPASKCGRCENSRVGMSTKSSCPTIASRRGDHRRPHKVGRGNTDTRPRARRTRNRWQATVAYGAAIPATVRLPQRRAGDSHPRAKPAGPATSGRGGRSNGAQVCSHRLARAMARSPTNRCDRG